MQLATQYLFRQLVLDLVLDHPPQRPGAKERVVAFLGDMLTGRRADLHVYLAVGQLLADLVQHQVDDGEDVLLGEGMEHHGGIHPVQELWPEELLYLVQDLILHALVVLAFRLGLVGLQREADDGLLGNQVGAQVAGHHDDGVAKVYFATFGVAQVAVVEDLEQDVEDLGVGLLDLVQQDTAVTLATHPFCKLATIIVAHVSRRGANEPGHSMPLLELRHVQPDHSVLVAEHELGEGPH